MWCRGAKYVVPWCQKCGAVVPKMWCEYLSIVEYKCSFYCGAKYVVPKCVVPWCQICGAVVPKMWCQLEPVISLTSGEI